MPIQVYGTVFKKLYIFVTYKSSQEARVLHNTRLERLANDKNANLLVQVVNYEEYEMLCYKTFYH
jgi:hypothetical protein